MLSKLPTSLPPHLALKFIKVYSNSGDLQRARHLFDKIPQPDLPTWTILISALTKHGRSLEAIQYYNDFRHKNCVEPDKLLLLSVAKACASLRDVMNARRVHEDAIRFGFCSDVLLGNALIDMYGKCRDVISWTSMASCYVNCGLLREALGAFRKMGLNGERPNSVTVSSILPACADLKDLKSGREVHGFVVRNGMRGNVFVSSALVNMYASCLSIRQAQLVFDSMSRRDTVSWNVLITAYFLNKECEKGLSVFGRMMSEGVELNYASWNAVIGGCMQNGRTEKALEVLSRMQNSGFKPNQITITTVLPACTNLESLRGGKQIHGYVFRHWFFQDLTTTTALVFMYAKCGDLELSRRVFSMMRKRDTVSWNTMIIANSMHGNGEEALLLFREMVDSGVRPNSVTFTGVLSGCSHSRLVDEGLLIFDSMSRDHSVEPDADHHSCMVDVLSRAGRLEEAYEFIKKMPIEPTAGAWGALLGGCRVYKNVELGRIAANRLFEIEPDNPGNYVLLSNILVSAKLWSEASETRKLMRDRGVTKNPGCSWIQVRNRVHTFVVGDKSNDHIVDSVFKNLRICGDCHNAIKFMAKIVGVQIIPHALKPASAPVFNFWF
ncbi:hypothetical protein AAG906_006926 [Vitis piasezkii]